MSGFDTSWLGLREPADKAARNEALLAELLSHLQNVDAPLIVDIGCGTGSTYRSLCDHVPHTARWRLIDYDDRLLNEAKARIGEGKATFFRHDLTDLEGLPLDGVTLMTASAVFDLCSGEFCDDLCSLLNRKQVGLYAALNYDGRIQWSESHPLDAVVKEAFNRHQRSDKGFGPALGPDAAAHIEAALSRYRYKVQTADSLWSLSAQHAALQEAFVSGMAAPVLEASDLTQDEIGSWLDFRLLALRNGGRLEVGHVDLLALPA